VKAQKKLILKNVVWAGPELNPPFQDFVSASGIFLPAPRIFRENQKYPYL